ncbi:MAG: hypothetical protein H6745_24590 [Deltaproteobacteria bacterium]|nr:hypothetical protein [Deltaproteobacteria bacterium]
MKRIAQLTAVLGTVLFAGQALANEPVEFSERPLTLTAGTLNAAAFFVVEGTPGDTGFRIDPVVIYGVTDDFEVGAYPAPVRLAPKTKYTNPEVFAAYRLLRGPIEIAPELGLVIPVEDGTHTVFIPAIRFLAGLQAFTSLHWTFEFPIRLTGGDPEADFRFDLQFRLNVATQIYLHVDTGVELPKYETDGGFVPFGLGVGYTLAQGDHAFADLEIGFRFPGLFLTGGGDTTNTDYWELAFSGSFFFGVGAD